MDHRLILDGGRSNGNVRKDALDGCRRRSASIGTLLKKTV